MAVEDAVEIVVSQAIEQGFINSEDLIDDYVLVTTIPVKGNPNNNADIENKLEEKISESEVLQEVNVAFNKATKNELKAAKEKSVSVGLYVLDQESDQTNVKEYFAEEALINQFEHFGTIIQKSEQAKVNEINKLLNTLEMLSVDVTAFRAKLSQEDVNYDSLIEELKGFIEQQEIQLPQNPGKSNNGNSNNPKNETTESPTTTDSNDNNGKNNNGNNGNSGKKNDQTLTTEPTSESVEPSTDSTTEPSSEPSTEPETKNPSGKPVEPKTNNGNNDNSNKGNSKGN